MDTRFLSACACMLLLAGVRSQGVWREVTPTLRPPLRTQPAMCWDSGRRQVVMFGGYDQAAKQWLQDTWEWDGFLWHEARPPKGPPAAFFAMVYDSARQRCVAFGGNQETWEWDGSLWTLQTPPARPPARDRHAMAYDAGRKRVVLFGGAVNNSPVNDTWEYDGITWLPVQPITAIPSARYGHAMAYDAAHRLVVMVGGSSNGTQTWVWDGRDWNLRTNLTFASGAILVYDQSRERLVYLGADRPAYNLMVVFSEEWDGNGWSVPQAAVGLEPRTDFGAAYDGRRGGILLFGGSGVAYLGRSDTWLYQCDCWAMREGHPGGSAPIACITAPVLGGRFCVAFGAKLGAGILLVGPGPCGDAWLRLGPPLLCGPGALYPGPSGLELLPAVGDPPMTCKSIPFDLTLVGQQLCIQGAGLETASCLRLTDGVRVVIRLP